MPDPWLTIVGIGEDGLSGLSDASRYALQTADVIFGGERHFALAETGAKARRWPIPFDVAPVLACRGQKTVVLASGDPFWHGAGGSLAAHLETGEWIAYPAPSTFSLAASRLGWRLEETLCLGLHAASFERLTPLLTPGIHAICLLRDGAAVTKLAKWLTDNGFGPSDLIILEALGGPNERMRKTRADEFALKDVTHPVAVAICADGAEGLPRSTGLPDDLFQHDGQITKRPVRALTLSALAPRPNQLLWDIGAGSGSISTEWCLAAPGSSAIAIEPRPDRIANIRANAAKFGLSHRIDVTEGIASEALTRLPPPHAVFVGGGASSSLLSNLWDRLSAGTRLVINAVTLETESLLAEWHAARGGNLIRMEIAEAAPLGRMRGWNRARPVVQWSVVR